MMKFFLRLSLLLWAVGDLCAARAAPIDAPPPLTVGQMHGGCQKTCWAVREAAKGAESLRDSMTLTCLNACFKCFLQLRSCSQSSANSAPSDCAAAFLQCYKQSFAERLKSKPLVGFDGGDGHSREMAVRIVGAANSLEGVPAEDFWIQLKHPGWRKKERRFVKEGGLYDVIVYETPNGPQTVWFDVKDFYEKNGEEDLRLLAPK